MMTMLPESNVTVLLSTITLKDIGKKNPTYFAGVLQVVFHAVNKALVPNIQKDLTTRNLSGSLRG